jgi:hypothetical protein
MGKGGSNTAAPAAFRPLSDEGRQYLLENPDVAAAGLDPWDHFNTYGNLPGEERMWPGGLDVGGPSFQDQIDGAITAFGHQQSASQAAAAAAAGSIASQAAKDRVTFGENERDALYTEYMNSANSATDYINSSINSERSNAALLGVKYDITDDQKSERISDYFASIWGEGDQQRLEGLFSEWGAVDGFTEFAITRGEDSTGESDTRTQNSTLSTTGGNAPSNKGPGNRRRVPESARPVDPFTTLGSANTLSGGSITTLGG